MKAEEFEGKNVDQAVEEAARFFRVPADQLEVEIITHGSTGLFGIGARKARIKARPREEFLLRLRAEEAEKVLAGVLSAAGFDLSFRVQIEDQKVLLDLSGPDREFIVARGGAPLNALQYLVNKIVARRLGVGPKIVLDVSGFRAEQERRLRSLARQAAEKARRTGRPVELKPMSPQERRLVHLALREFQGIETRSKGQGSTRRVVIYPKGRASGRRR